MNKKLLAEALLEIACKSDTTFVEVGKEDKELVETAEKLGIFLPSPDFLLMKTIYAEINKANRNGVILPKDAVEQGLSTLLFKQCNWEHEGKGRVCGFTISAKIVGDTVETINVLFKSLFPEEIEILKEKIKTKEAAVSFEIYNRNEFGESVVHELENGFRSISPILFHGTGVLLVNPPACPKAKIFKMIGSKEIENAEKIVDKVFGEDLIFASMAIEEPKCKNCNSCTCEKEVKLVEEIKKEEIVANGVTYRLCPECQQPMNDDDIDICATCKKKKTEKSSEETQTETKTEETKTEEKSEVAETKSEEVAVEETKEEPVIEAEVIVEEKKEEPVIEAEVIVEEKKEEVIEKVVTVTYTEAQLEEKILSIKAEKDAEIVLLKAEYEKVLSEKDKEIAKTQEELGKKSQEIEQIKVEKAALTKKDEQPSLTVGEVTAPGEDTKLKSEKKAVSDFIASKHKK